MTPNKFAECGIFLCLAKKSIPACSGRKNLSGRYLPLWICLILYMLLTFFSSCTPPSQAGSASETIYGKIVDSNYEAVGGILVILCAGGEELDTVCIDSTFTISNGEYSFENVTSGTYSLKAGGGESGSMAYRQGIMYPSAKVAKDLGTDTLKIPGRLKARFVYGSCGTSLTACANFIKDVFCYLRNTHFFGHSDSTGVFFHPAVVPGTYTLRCVPPRPFSSFDTVFTILSGSAADLGDIHLKADPAFLPPPVQNIALSYDTLTGTVTLAWPPIRVSDLHGYVVYRGPLDGAPEPISGIIADTVFSDSVLKTNPLLLDSVLRYFVKAIDTSANQSENMSAPSMVKIVSPELVATRMQFDLTGTLAAGDEKSVVLIYDNPTRINKKITWRTDDGATLLREREIHSRQGADTLVVQWDKAGVRRIKVVITDIQGNAWADSFAVTLDSALGTPDSWSVIDTSAPCQGQTTVAGVIDSIVYLISQKTQTSTYGIFSFNVKSNRWKYVSDIPQSRKAVAATLHNGAIYVAGGQPLVDSSSSRADKYDLQSNEWIPLPNTLFGHTFSKLVSVHNNLYLAGGMLFGIKPINHLLMLENDSTWLRKKSMSTNRCNFAAAVHDSSIFLFGGKGTYGNLQHSERYHLLQDSWTSVSPLKTPGKGLAAAVLDTLIFISGLSSNDTPFSSNMAYNMKTGEWLERKPMHFPRTDHGAAAVYDQIYIFCGSSPLGGDLRSVEKYTP